MPNFLNVLISTSDNITVECASQPFKSVKASKALAHKSLVEDSTAKATNTSLVCSLGLCPLRDTVFNF